MNSDLQGELGPLDPGLDQLIGALTAGAASGELAGEQAALAMFREHSRSSVRHCPGAGPAGRTGHPGRTGPATTAAPARRPAVLPGPLCGPPGSLLAGPSAWRARLR